MIESGRLAHRGPFPEEFLLILSVLLDFSHIVFVLLVVSTEMQHMTLVGVNFQLPYLRLVL